MYEVPLPHQVIPRYKVAKTNQLISFKCTGARYTRWFYEKRELPRNAISFSRDEMTIFGVNKQNAGYYYCYGHNGTSSEKPFLSHTQLVLRGKPTLEPSVVYQYVINIMDC